MNDSDEPRRHDSPRVAVDAMGGDFGAAEAAEAVRLALDADEALRVEIVGDADVLDPLLGDWPRAVRERLRRIGCARAIDMNTPPSRVLRDGSDSTMSLAIDALARRRVDAVVSPGSTGALMALSRARLGMLPGIERPALMTAFPVSGGQAWVLDLGANLGVDAERLTEFGRLAGAAVTALLGRRPRVGLLNIGTEPNKGPDVVREAGRRLAETPLDYVGFVEGHDVFAGKADVVVCDGFAGNVLLKSAEGALGMAIGMLEDAGSAWWGGGHRRAARHLHERLHPDRHNGASLLGVDGIVIKSHAHASVPAFANAIALAALEVRRDMMGALEGQLWMDR
ncbi:MAG: phosphate acyltransferase PlsX [Wenzhouxiangellaceae bacterium]|nr:phosphate acyltransferase PlsX [Wenzhouxiangellaceae bacterium]